MQASEKAWGAVAHCLKSIANRRGLKYDTHRDVFAVVRELSGDTEDADRVRLLFNTAHGLHKNYYVDAMPLEALEQQIGDVKALLDILGSLE